MGTQDYERPRYMISVAAELVGMHPQTLRIYESKGLVRPGPHARRDAALLRARPRPAAADPAADDRARAQPRRRRARDRARGRDREDARALRPARAGDARGDRARCTASTGATSWSTASRADSRQGGSSDGLQQADDQVAGGGRRRAGARAPPRQPRALPRAPAARAARPGAAARARRVGRRAARRGRGEARDQKPRIEGTTQQPSASAAVLEGARPCRRRGEEARGRVRLDRAPAARARRRPARRAAREDQGGARRPAGHLAGPRGHLPGAGEVRPRPDRGAPRAASSTR